MAEDICISSPVLGLMKGRGISSHPSSWFSFSPEFRCSLRGYKVLPQDGSEGLGVSGGALHCPRAGSCFMSGGSPSVPQDPATVGPAGKGPYLMPAGWGTEVAEEGAGWELGTGRSSRPFPSGRSGEDGGAVCQSKLQP